MAGCSPAAAKRNRSMSQRGALQIALHGMLSIKPQDIKLSLYKSRQAAAAFSIVICPVPIF